MAPPTFGFASARTANRLVAGVPAAARLAREWQLASPGVLLELELPDAEALSPLARAEITRLAPGLVVTCVAAARGPVIAAETQPDAMQIAALLAGTAALPLPPADPDAALNKAGRAIIRATTKPGDGYISVYINRPISQAASGWLLRFAAVRPGHATVITALCGAMMFACLLLLPSEAGLIAGAALFQLASVADGIDGEIARATFRSSKRGASWDSAVDAATNAGFFVGVGANYAMRGLMGEAAIAFGTVAILLLGLAALGLRSVINGEPLNFEAVKRRFKASPSRWQTRLAALTGRDTYCFGIFVLAMLGLIELAMGIMLGAAIIWLLVVITAMRTDPGDQLKDG